MKEYDINMIKSLLMTLLNNQSRILAYLEKERLKHNIESEDDENIQELSDKIFSECMEYANQLGIELIKNKHK